LDGPTLAVDLPGFGRSCLGRAASLDCYAAEVEHALDRIGARRFVLGGHSFGGGVATALAKRRGDAVAALVLLAPVGFGRVPLAEACALPIVRSVLDRVFPLALSRPSLMRAAYSLAGGRAPDSSQLARLAREPVKLVAAARQAVGAIVAAGAAGDGFHRRKVGYHGPVHCVWGGRDRVVSVSHLDGVEAAFHRVRAHVWRKWVTSPSARRRSDWWRCWSASGTASTPDQPPRTGRVAPHSTAREQPDRLRQEPVLDHPQALVHLVGVRDVGQVDCGRAVDPTKASRPAPGLRCRGALATRAKRNSRATVAARR
jgi:pimeloyl-ACP methyl ester carboxylesterase